MTPGRGPGGPAWPRLLAGFLAFAAGVAAVAVAVVLLLDILSAA